MILAQYKALPESAEYAEQALVAHVGQREVELVYASDPDAWTAVLIHKDGNAVAIMATGAYGIAGFRIFLHTEVDELPYDPI